MAMMSKTVYLNTMISRKCKTLFMPKAIPFVFTFYYGGYKIYCLHYTEFKLSGRNGCFELYGSGF